jgi:hypothetical protein
LLNQAILYLNDWKLFYVFLDFQLIVLIFHTLYLNFNIKIHNCFIHTYSSIYWLKNISQEVFNFFPSYSNICLMLSKIFYLFEFTNSLKFIPLYFSFFICLNHIEMIFLYQKIIFILKYFSFESYCYHIIYRNVSIYIIFLLYFFPP